jgi:hypothetical protein
MINICRIIVAAFRLNLKKEENIFFTILLLEIDRELGDRKEQEFAPGTQ